ncbi:ABC-F family ATP-binding cassette domain-containing protein [Collinsella sp. AGMB00827]|uniref:ABC-F family ATP-binding cassette domain-containing protein n=1 Tax=Collinsella ureilytica TaxID=2869515 RepID=A0ABS7MLY7_9ACTN|nr:ABC-F family ATP-binding cassette domain-containing protein [Collinsella urealyticum]MBY4798387.1 ABC-F family ATP-binding cassette domain-containing protein [Collinsella urealyticum]
MAILLGCDQVHLAFPTKLVLDEVTLGVNEGDRIGIVGRNGDGKSTLLSVLATTIEPDAGRVTHRRNLHIGLLSQHDKLDDTLQVGQSIVGDMPEFEWAADPQIREILTGLVSDIPWEAYIGTLSGGQRRRVDLARLLIGDWDVLMLDEPTNHLDMRTINWLASHLKNRWQTNAGALLVVTHDRWFLDEVCTSMWEVHDGAVDPFEGGYSAYILQRVERDRQAQVAEDRRRNMARKELAWLARGAQARSSKPKFRVDAARTLIADVPPLRDELELKRLAVARLGKKVIDLTHVQAGHIDPETETITSVIKDVTWLIGPGDRFGLLGANGAGKSTLIDVITGALQPISGSVKIGATVQFGLLSQGLDELKPHAQETIKDVLTTYKRTYIVDGKETSPEKLLEQLGFSADQLMSRIADLSGGQLRRLSLLLTILTEPNVLILDEPGNDLDTDMLAVVEDLLDGWPGTLILVTHDRFLMERVTDHQFALMHGSLRHLPKGVDEYLALAAAEAQKEPAAQVGAKEQSDRSQSDADTHKLDSQASAAPEMSNAERQQLRREAASLERRIAVRRDSLTELESEMDSIDPTDYEALAEHHEAIDAMREEIDELETSWLIAMDQLEA